MTFLEAAEEILRGAKKPMTASQITDRALKRGLVRTRGQTPKATMSAALYGAPAAAPIRRIYREGPTRAARNSVRWAYVAQKKGDRAGPY